MSARWNLVHLFLHVITLTLVVSMFLSSRPGEDEDDDPATLEELVDEIGTARYQLRSQADRLSRLLDQLQRGQLQLANGGGAAIAPIAAGGDEPKTPLDLLDRLAEVTDVHERHKHDPLQRESVEKERARLEDLLRQAGDDTIGALFDFFPSVSRKLTDARPGWMRTRLLTHVVDQIDSEAAADFAFSVFEDPQYNSGVRLKAAASALGRYEDRVIVALVRLLTHPDPTFSRPEQVVQFFKANKDERAIPALCQLAQNIDGERTARRFCLETLGEYDDPRVLDALKEVATFDVHGDLRGVAIVSLNKLMGADIIPFVDYLRSQWEVDDPLHQLLDNTEAAAKQAAAGG